MAKGWGPGDIISRKAEWAVAIEQQRRVLAMLKGTLDNGAFFRDSQEQQEDMIRRTINLSDQIADIAETLLFRLVDLEAQAEKASADLAALRDRFAELQWRSRPD